MLQWQLVGADNAKITLRHRRGDERSFIDLVAGFGAFNFGHCNPDIDPFRDSQPDMMPGVYPPEGELFASWLCDRLALPDHKVLFQIGGSFAVSSALALAQHVRPGRILSVEGAFHGLGLDSLSLAPGHEAGTLFNTRLLKCVSGEVDVIAPGQRPSRWSEYSCFIYETVQGSAGHIKLPVEWLAEMEHAARRSGVTVIADEILCGYFRHGWFSPARSQGLNPTILLYGKSMTNGLYPYSAVVYSPEVEDAVSDEIFGEHTFQASALGCRAAMRVARYLDRFDHHAAIGRLQRLFASAMEQFVRSGDVVGAHNTACTLSLRPTVPAERVAERCFDEGVLVTVSGKSDEYISLVPPLTIEEEVLFRAMQTAKRCLR
jgi:acetylornithine/succinyldiaminopimelate/putrescine aminotransferase